MHIRLLLIAFTWLMAVPASAQKIKHSAPCAVDLVNPALSARRGTTDRQIADWIRNRSAGRSPAELDLVDSIKTIPVVVHVIHNGGSENISAAQIASQIEVLNEDFGKLLGTPGDGQGVDTRIRFCLAKKTPDGRCTDGIVRIQSPLSVHKTYERSELAALSNWDPARYLNIYVVRSINTGTTLGYASYPGGPEAEDGAVMAYNYFGRTGAVASNTSGRTATHEIGHWFGLYHTFNGGCDTDTCSASGDLVCDTPPVANPNFGCPNANTCSNDQPNLPDQVDNYMDYTNDNCKHRFTEGQRIRMHGALSTQRPDVWQAWNLVATGCDSGYVSPVCGVVADFTSNNTAICKGNPVQFINRSLNQPTTFQWSFPGGSPASLTDLNPVVTYADTGSYDVLLIAGNTMGLDTLYWPGYITVHLPAIGMALPYTEGFEGEGFPPGGIILENPDGGVTWERDTVAVAYEGQASAKINNLINTNYGQADRLELPLFDFTTVPRDSLYLRFRWAYARSDANYSDELVVQVSTDCGVNFVQKFYRTGNNLVTGPTQTTPYVPDSTTVWKLANIDLRSFDTSDHVQIRIVNVTDGGNNLYIDAIRLGGSPVSSTELPASDQSFAPTLAPNPALDRTQLSLPAGSNRPLHFRLFNSYGQELRRYEAPVVADKLDLQGLARGIYFVQIHSGTRRTTLRLVKL
jgi:PKD repeat protein